MTYTVRTYAEYKADSPGSITVQDGFVTYDTSVGFVGNKTRVYSQAFSENDLWLLENFADATPPLNPMIGQAWYDTGLKTSRNWDGIQWTSPITLDTVQSDVLPSATLVYDLGSSSLQFAEGHISNLYSQNLDIVIPESGNSGVTPISIKRQGTAGGTSVLIYSELNGGFSLTNRADGSGSIGQVTPGGSISGTYVNLANDTSVSLMFNSSNKIRTTTDGVAITGLATLDTLPSSYGANDLIPLDYLSTDDIISENNIADGSITSDKIADSAVTFDQLDSSVQDSVSNSTPFASALYTWTTSQDITLSSGGQSIYLVFSPAITGVPLTELYNTTGDTIYDPGTGEFNIPSNVEYVSFTCNIALGLSDIYNEFLAYVLITGNGISFATTVSRGHRQHDSDSLYLSLSTPPIPVSSLNNQQVIPILIIESEGNNGRDVSIIASPTSFGIKYEQYTIS